MASTDFETLVVEKQDGVALIRLNRPEVLNALNSTVARELTDLIGAIDRDPEVACSIITGSEKAFAAGADISEMEAKSYMDMYGEDFFSVWDKLASSQKPVIAAVAGYALGGGCELAMMCDFIIAAENAKFGQPEIKLGVMPGMGGSQRLTRFVGKSVAMDMCLTGRMMDADEAKQTGLVSRVVPVDRLLDEALEAAATIASFSRPIARMTKETVNRAYEMTLTEGIRFERRVFHAMFSTEDQKEGMSAFVAKRKADFKHR